jgi:hypothetical protein
MIHTKLMMKKVIDANNSKIFQYVASIMECTVPLIDFPSSDFINSLSKDLSTLVTKAGMPVRIYEQISY